MNEETDGMDVLKFLSLIYDLKNDYKPIAVFFRYPGTRKEIRVAKYYPESDVYPDGAIFAIRNGNWYDLNEWIWTRAVMLEAFGDKRATEYLGEQWGAGIREDENLWALNLTPYAMRSNISYKRSCNERL